MVAECSARQRLHYVNIMYKDGDFDCLYNVLCDQKCKSPDSLETTASIHALIHLILPTET